MYNEKTQETAVSTEDANAFPKATIHAYEKEVRFLGRLNVEYATLTAVLEENGILQRDGLGLIVRGKTLNETAIINMAKRNTIRGQIDSHLRVLPDAALRVLDQKNLGTIDNSFKIAMSTPVIPPQYAYSVKKYQ